MSSRSFGLAKKISFCHAQKASLFWRSAALSLSCSHQTSPGDFWTYTQGCFTGIGDGGFDKVSVLFGVIRISLLVFPERSLKLLLGGRFMQAFKVYFSRDLLLLNPPFPFQGHRGAYEATMAVQQSFYPIVALVMFTSHWSLACTITQLMRYHWLEQGFLQDALNLFFRWKKKCW